MITDLEGQVDDLEEKLIDNSEHASRGELINLRRQAILFRRYLGPQREALNRLYSERVTWFSQNYLMVLRESIDKLTRYIEELDAIRERTAVAYEELSSRLSDQLNKRMYLLSIITGIFLPLSFLTGLLGVNVGGIPLANSPWGFVIVVGFLLITAIGEFIYFRMQRWL